MRWLSRKLVLAIHDRQLSEHGGSSGARDGTLLESVLARPQQLHADGDPRPDVAALAAWLAFGIASSHPFVDGNKRTAYVACRLFLVLNGTDIVAAPENKYRTFLDLGAGELGEDLLAEWLRRHLRPA